MNNPEGIYFLSTSVVNWIDACLAARQVFTRNEYKTGDWIDQKLNYMQNNQVEVGIVREPEHFAYSSASNYAGKGGELKVISLYDGIEI